MKYLRKFNESVEYVGNIKMIHDFLASHGFEDQDSFANPHDLIMRLSKADSNCDAQMSDDKLSISLQDKRGRERDLFSLDSFGDADMYSLEEWLRSVR